MNQTITLTPEQSSAFQRGESVTLVPTPPEPPRKTYIAVSMINGKVVKLPNATRTEVSRLDARNREKISSDTGVIIDPGSSRHARAGDRCRWVMVPAFTLVEVPS